jgi:transcriptional regulator with XRE-family HTH domain
MSGEPDSEAQKAMGSRLQAVREAIGLTQDDMAKNMGVVVTTLSAWESGRNQIDIVKLARSATRWGFTTDWVARGDLSGLRKDVAEKVEAILAMGPGPRRGRRRAPHPPATSPDTPKERAPPKPPFREGGRVKENRVSRPPLTLVAPRRPCPQRTRVIDPRERY